MSSSKTKNRDVSLLVDKAKGGCNESMAQLFDLFAPEIYRYAYSLTKCRDMAEDVVSETFSRTWSNFDTFKKGNFRAFLYTIARNYSFDLLRKEQHTTPLTELHDTLTASSEVLDEVVAKEQNDRLLSALLQLSDTQREVVVLRFFEQLSVRETAKIIGKSAVNVRVIQHRAINQLQKHLHE